MKVVIINGSGGVGKDEFCHLCNELTGLKCITYSTITRIKSVARQLGWTGIKDKKSRKFLSDLKNLSVSYNDFLFEQICKDIEGANTINNIEIFFVMCREPEEIKKLQEKFNAITILIKNKRVETQKYENKSDDNVNNYNYNYYIYNDGTLEELKDWAKWFLLKIGVEINDKVY